MIRDKKSMLIIDDDEDLLKMLSLYFKKEGYEVTGCISGQRALHVLEQELFDVIVTDLMLSDASGLDILNRSKEVAPSAEVVIVTGHSSVDTAVQAMKQGAYEYITKPIDLDELNIIVHKACERQQLLAEVSSLRSQVKSFYNPDNIVAASAQMHNLIRIVKRISSSTATVLIEGESGVGKEVIARAIHGYGIRSDKPFVAINCGALPDTLLESELFGHVRGAFTGANATKKGLFEEANRGTIFLDEIAETTPAFQVKLLRVLQENEIRRVGDTRDIAVDVRVLASSNKPMRALVDAGRFRQDLYFRLRVVPVRIPPLRERIEDIIPLARFFIDRYCRKNGRSAVVLGADAIKKLEAYQWPGNVRELENAIERAMILAEGDGINAENIQLEPPAGNRTSYAFESLGLKEIEKIHIQHVLDACEWNQTDAARRLGIGYNTLWRKIKQYAIER